MESLRAEPSARRGGGGGCASRAAAVERRRRPRVRGEGMRTPGEAKSARCPFPTAPPAIVRTAAHGRRTHPPSLEGPGFLTLPAPTTAHLSEKSSLSPEPPTPQPPLISHGLAPRSAPASYSNEHPALPAGPRPGTTSFRNGLVPTPSGPAHSVRLPPNLLSRRSSGFEPRPACSNGLSRVLCWRRSPTFAERLKCSRASQARRKRSKAPDGASPGSLELRIAA